MSTVKRPLYLHPDHRLTSFPQGTSRPVRCHSSPYRRRSRLRRSLLRRSRTRVIVNIVLALLIVALCVAVYSALLWLLGGVALGWLASAEAHVHVH